MNLKKIGLSVGVFTLAIAGAFATSTLSGGNGYTNEQQIRDQGAPCVFRTYCAGGSTTCTYSVGIYTYQCLQLESNGTCSSTVLSKGGN
jgi:hypothetical protein